MAVLERYRHVSMYVCERGPTLFCLQRSEDFNAKSRGTQMPPGSIELGSSRTVKLLPLSRSSCSPEANRTILLMINAAAVPAYG
jgi:hypothetical protein